MGRGNASIRLKGRNLVNGKIRDFTYNSGAHVEEADVEVVKTNFKYRDGQSAYFENGVTLPLSEYEDKVLFLKSGIDVSVVLFEEEPIDLLIPITVDLEVKSTAGSDKGNTVSGAYKEAIMETGLRIQVPMFVKEGDELKINTETASYVTRV